MLVIPFAAGTFPGGGQTVNYLQGPVLQLDAATSPTPGNGSENPHRFP